MNQFDIVKLDDGGGLGELGECADDMLMMTIVMYMLVMVTNTMVAILQANGLPKTFCTWCHLLQGHAKFCLWI